MWIVELSMDSLQTSFKRYRVCVVLDAHDEGKLFAVEELHVHCAMFATYMYMYKYQD